jgi:hypothetical protein
MSLHSHLDASACEYAIITPGAGGYGFTRLPAEGRILRHRRNPVPTNLPDRQFYLRDQESGEFRPAARRAAAPPPDGCKTGPRFALAMPPSAPATPASARTAPASSPTRRGWSAGVSRLSIHATVPPAPDGATGDLVAVLG